MTSDNDECYTPLQDKLRPMTLNEIAGHDKVKRFIEKCAEAPRSIILQGQAGTGKTSLALVYKNLASQFLSYVLDGPATNTEDLRIVIQRAYSSGPMLVIIDEIQYLSKKQQQLLLTPIEMNKIILIATTTEYVNSAVHEGIRSRCTVFILHPPTPEEIKRVLIRGVAQSKRKIDYDILNRLAVDCNGDVRHAFIVLDSLFLLSDENITVEQYAELETKAISTITVEEYKSALQKSIRGSDPDAAALYALALLDMRELEALCRRIRVIVSEDLGLAVPNGPTIVNELIVNALQLGMPEARYPILHAVVWMAIQPKSNALAVLIEKYEELDGAEIVPPNNIRYTHSSSYVYPHTFPNHWVKQNYLPNNMQSLSLYQPQGNKTEQAFAGYWKGIKEHE